MLKDGNSENCTSRLRQNAAVGACIFALLALSGCSGGDEQFQPADNLVNSSTAVPTGAEANGSTTDPNFGDPNFIEPTSDLPISIQPVPVQLSTSEETTVSGMFAISGVPANNELVIPDFKIISRPSNGTLVHGAGSSIFSYTPARDFSGIDTFEYGIVEDRRATVTIAVSNNNDAPVLFADILPVIEQGTAYSAFLDAVDPDDNIDFFEATNLPAWLFLNTVTGELSGTPSRFDIGVFSNIEFRVVDSAGLSSEVVDVDIEVIASNDAPIINVDRFPEDIDAGEVLEVNLFPDDPNGDDVVLAFEPNDLLDISVVGGSVIVIASEVEEVTTVDMVLLATDVRGGTTRSTVPLKIHPVNASGRGRTVHGKDGNGDGIHLVVLGDGYREDQQAQFRLDVQSLIDKMQEDVGMSTHFSAWNVHMVATPSVDSGIDDNLLVDARSTVYGTGYFCKSISRLICGDTTKMFAVAIEEYPNFDQLLVLVNDSRQGGSGGQIAISSTSSLEIALHEMGHSIAKLADEYVDQNFLENSSAEFEEGQFANVSQNSTAATVPWSHWLTEDPLAVVTEPSTEVGIFEGAYYRATEFFRPTEDSLMRNYTAKLGPVNSEQWALRVYFNARPIVNLSPATDRVVVRAGETVNFSVDLRFGQNLQSVEWRLDSRVIPDSGLESPSVSLSFPAGEYEVAVTVRDISGLIRKPEPHRGMEEWVWKVVVE